MAQKYKVGEKVKFLFLTAPHTGIIKEFHQFDTHGVQRPRYLISDGKYTYPTPVEQILGKICERK